MTLLYGLSAAPASQPKNAVLGQVVSLGIAIGIGNTRMPLWLKQPLATSLAVAAMVKLGVTHPPAGAAALIYSSGNFGWGNMLFMLVGNVVRRSCVTSLDILSHAFPQRLLSSWLHLSTTGRLQGSIPATGESSFRILIATLKQGRKRRRMHRKKRRLGNYADQCSTLVTIGEPYHGKVHPCMLRHNRWLYIVTAANKYHQSLSLTPARLQGEESASVTVGRKLCVTLSTS